MRLLWKQGCEKHDAGSKLTEARTKAVNHSMTCFNLGKTCFAAYAYLFCELAAVQQKKKQEFTNLQNMWGKDMVNGTQTGS